MTRSILRSIVTTIVCLSAASAQWLQTGGPYGASIYSLTTSGSTIIAASMSGVYRTTNDGITWSQSNGIPASAQVARVLPSNGALYAATSAGPFVSANNGVTWTTLDSAGKLGNVTAVFAKDSFLFAGTNGGVYRSTNGGKTWSTKFDSTISDREVRTFFGAGNIVFAGTMQGLFRSTNYGATWKIADSLLNGNNPVYEGVLVGTKIYAAAYPGVFVSSDTGKTWAPVKGTEVKRIMLCIASDGTNLVAGSASSQAYRSTNGGDSWTALGTLPNISVVAMTFRGSNIFAGTDWGVSLSTNNGSTWADMNTGITGTYIVSIGRANGEFLALSGTSGLFNSVNNGITWNQNPNSLKNALTYALLADSVTYYLASSRGVYRSTDAGLSWTIDSAGLGPNNYVFSFLKNGSVFAAGMKGVFERVNGVWQPRNVGLSPNEGANKVWSAGAAMYTFNGDSLYRSVNKGASWTFSGTGLPSYAFINDMAVVDSALFAASNIGVYVSKNGGQSWTLRSSGVGGPPQCLLTVNGNLFVGTNGSGVYVQKAKDTVWSAANAGMLSGKVATLYTENNTLFAGTNSGIWKRPLNEMITAVRIAESSPVMFSLQQNYPNPFNPSTTIRFSVAQSGPATLTVFDALGRTVSTLVKEPLVAGRWYEQSFDAARLASGIYYARLQSGGHQQIMKMVLAK